MVAVNRFFHQRGTKDPDEEEDDFFVFLRDSAILSSFRSTSTGWWRCCWSFSNRRPDDWEETRLRDHIRAAALVLSCQPAAERTRFPVGIIKLPLLSTTQNEKREKKRKSDEEKDVINNYHVTRIFVMACDGHPAPVFNGQLATITTNTHIYVFRKSANNRKFLLLSLSLSVEPSSQGDTTQKR